MSALVHGLPQASPALARLAFLVGHYQGAGRYASASGEFRKSCTGHYEAGGQFLSLRMEATYPMPDGSRDVHSALVIVGADAGTGALTARVYTDAGIVRDCCIETRDGSIAFTDQPPGHGTHWTRARKILTPIADGYDERLEVADADGSYTLYYTVAMRSAIGP